MFNCLLTIYLTILPIVLAGISNMIFTKTALYKKHKRPIDGGKLYKDGRRIFGDNKTYIGFFSMILINSITQILCGLVYDVLQLNQYSDLYVLQQNTFHFNAMFGALTGFAYMIAELPNSFIKRRLNIDAGKTVRGIKGIIFFIVDQTDSLIGIAIVYWFFNRISFIKCVVYVIVGAFTHIAVNSVLYSLRIRKNL